MSQTPQCYWHGWVRLHSVIGTTKSDSTVLLAPMSQTHSVIGTAEPDSTVLLAPLSQSPQSYWHRWARLHSLIGTNESDSTVLLALMSQTPECYWHRKVQLKSTYQKGFLQFFKGLSLFWWGSFTNFRHFFHDSNLFIPNMHGLEHFYVEVVQGFGDISQQFSSCEKNGDDPCKSNSAMP